MPAQILEFGKITTDDIIEAAERFGTPVYVNDESMIAGRCRDVIEMFTHRGFESINTLARYAMKANPSKGVLQIANLAGMHIDAGSLNEVRRAASAGFPEPKILLTSQDVPRGDERKTLERRMMDGMHYTVCSLRQLELIAEFAGERRFPLSIRVHPVIGSGESITRTTGGKYACFGIKVADLPKALEIAGANKIKFERVHTHIGSGADPKLWAANIDWQLGIIGEYFPDATIANFGGGLKEERMPDKKPADVMALGKYALEKVKAFNDSTGRNLAIEVEPGTYVVANAGYIITRVMDKKDTGDDGYKFIITDGGMEVNSRPLLYGAKHPVYVVRNDSELLSSEFELAGTDPKTGLAKWVIVGRCCESGDSQTLSETGHIEPRKMAEPDIGDYIVIGGGGAYCSAMSLSMHQSNLQAPEVMRRTFGDLELIRRRQTLEQLTENEIPLTLPKAD